MAKFDFRRQLKGLNLKQLRELREYHVEYMLAFVGLNEKEADKHSRYVNYITEAINKLKQQEETSYVQK